MVACKTVGEYKRNQEKIRKFCLDEAKKQIAARKPLGTKRTKDAINSAMDPPGPSSSIANITDAHGTSKATTRNKASINTPGTSRMATSNKATTKQTKKKHMATKNINTRTKWSRAKLTQIATKNQRQQQNTTSKTPKGVSKAKTKHSTPLSNFNERAKQAAILNSKETNSIRRKLPSMSDTDTSNRSF